MTRGNALSEAYMATPTQLKARKGNLNDGGVKGFGFGAVVAGGGADMS